MNAIPIKNKIIIWGRDGFNVLGLLRALAGLDVFFLVKGERGYACRSKYCRQSHTVRDDEEGYSYLIDNFSSEAVKSIIITPGDEIANFINNHRDELDKFFILPGTAEKGLQEKYTDKNNMVALAKEIGIRCPESHFCRWDSNIDDIKYPCLIKPAHEKPGHYNEFKYKICKNRASLKRTLSMVRPDSEFIVQEYVKKESEVLVYGARFFSGETYVAGSMVKDRFTSSGAGSHALIIGSILCDINLQLISAFLQNIDYYGCFSFEFGISNGKSYFFEVNLRNDGTSHYFLQSGANIPLAYVYSCVGLDYTEVPMCIENDRWFIDELFDIENVIKGNVSYGQYKRDKERATVYKYYDKGDTAPYEYLKKSRWKLIATDVIVKRFRIYIVFLLDKLGLRK